MTSTSNCYERRIARLAISGELLDIDHEQCPNPFIPGSQFVGLDLRIAHNCPYKEQVQGDVSDIVFLLSDRRFDGIVASELIEHFGNSYLFLRDVRSLLRPGARLILLAPNRLGWPTAFSEWFMYRRFFCTYDHRYYFAPRWVARMPDQTGFSLSLTVSVGFWPFGIALKMPVLLSDPVIYCADRLGYQCSQSAAGPPRTERASGSVGERRGAPCVRSMCQGRAS